MPKRLYAEIAKTEKQPDGTLMVEGYASSGAVDSDGETVTPDAMKAAIPDYMAFGAVREMHDSKKAAGTAVQIEVQDDGKTRFVAHVVDPVAVLKVETGVYKGFSIGAGIPKGGRDEKDRNIIKAIRLTEISLVDRPANPEARIEMYKADRGPEDDEDSEGGGHDLGIRKGLYNVQSMVQAMSYLRDCASCIDYEVQSGEHGEDMSKGIKSCLKALGAFCQKYLGEEVSMLGKAELEGELAKAASAAAEPLQSKVEELTKAADERATQDKEQADQVAEVAKAAGIEIKEGALYADLLKGAFVQLIERTGQVDAANKEISELRKRAAVPKAFLHSQAIGKADDVTALRDGEGGVRPITKSGPEGSEETNEVATLIKAAQTRPIPVSMPG